LLALAGQADSFQSIIDLDSPEFLSPENMVRSIRKYCKHTGQPEPSTVGAMVRCILESLALKYRWGLDALEDLVEKRLDTIHIVGGGSRNDLLCQFCSNACDRPVVSGPAEATALGNIMVQALSTGFLTDLASGREAISASIRQRHFEPRSVTEWQEAYERFLRLIT
jgi:rhamnulokinase